MKKNPTAPKPSKVDRELVALMNLERQLVAFVNVFSRAKQNHEPFRLAAEHAIQERTLLSAAMAGNPDAIRTRKLSNEPSPDGVGQ